MQKEDASTTSSSSLDVKQSEDTSSSSRGTTRHSDSGDGSSTTTSSSDDNSSMDQSKGDTKGSDDRSHELRTSEDTDAKTLASFLDQFQGIEQALVESAEKEGNDEKTVLYAIDYIANSS